MIKIKVVQDIPEKKFFVCKVGFLQYDYEQNPDVNVQLPTLHFKKNQIKPEISLIITHQQNTFYYKIFLVQIMFIRPARREVGDYVNDIYFSVYVSFLLFRPFYRII